MAAIFFMDIIIISINLIDSHMRNLTVKKSFEIHPLDSVMKIFEDLVVAMATRGGGNNSTLIFVNINLFPLGTDASDQIWIRSGMWFQRKSCLIFFSFSI